MTERLVALVLLTGCVAYGRASQDIQLLFGAEFSPFNARTFPWFLAWSGGLLSLGILVFPGSNSRDPAFAGLAWKPALFLSVLVVGYALVIPFTGFFVASFLFLSAAIISLGERRLMVFVPVAIGVALGLFLILNTLLGIYLDDPLLRTLGVN
ncbi:tripartite tricarboxylate transporter TctB family protein [Mameliella alba]|uniref:tripartite tricarboxylate transporter TctB family protein n=1 Tax=Mameliella alba TaxID=561184 RepID=UPI001C983D96|nr:tripartite tricarboxylate transporter TctB family protein [Mameliella alba]MBY6120404.1 tripartite tricarboxylate transporter TctB family protein [Mameliella alba]